MACTICSPEMDTHSHLIYQDTIASLSHSGMDIPGYLIIAPTRHVENFWELTSEEIQKISHISQEACKILAAIEGVEIIYILSFGEITRHFHMHLFPRYRWMEKEYKKIYEGDVDGARLFSEMRKKYTQSFETKSSEVEQVIVLLRQALGASL